MADNAKKLAILSEAAELILKGGGILAIAGVVGATALKMKALMIVIPMVLAGVSLWAFAGFLFMLAVIKLEEAFITPHHLPEKGATIIGYLMATSVVFSMVGLMFDLGAEVTAK